MHDATLPDALLVDARTAARMLSISERSLWSITAPRGPVAVVVIGRSVRYSIDDLQKFIDHQKQQRPASDQTGEPSVNHLPRVITLEVRP